MSLYVAVPDDAIRGGVIVVHEAFGVTRYIEGVVQSAARAGYLAVAPNLFYRTLTEPLPYGDHAAILPHIASLEDTRIQSDLGATLDYFTTLGIAPEAIGMVGFCIGGRIAFLAAATMQFGGAVGLYGGGIVSAPERFAASLPSLLPRAPSLMTPWLGLFGDLDHTIAVSDVERLRQALAGTDVPTEIVRYPDAGHAFHCSDRDSYVPDAAEDAWKRVLEWFDRHLGSANDIGTGGQSYT